MLMTKAAYARHKGVSHQTVYDWIARGELVLVGRKIDVNASSQKTIGGITAPPSWDIDSDKKVNISPKATMISPHDDFSQERHQPFYADAEKAAAMVLTLDDAYPPAADYEALQERILDAADMLELEIRTLDIEGEEDAICGIALYDPAQECEVMRFDSFLFELEALTFLRWLVVNKRFPELESATKAG
ncbi:hypothetical protein, partial [Pluralibacter sp.]|uniref:hypothetical protein n=1 Tax=Pluralibacter sp. TaxID=1920032 RepID=UPI0025E2A2DE